MNLDEHRMEGTTAVVQCNDDKKAAQESTSMRWASSLYLFNFKADLTSLNAR